MNRKDRSGGGSGSAETDPFRDCWLEKKKKRQRNDNSQDPKTGNQVPFCSKKPKTDERSETNYEDYRAPARSKKPMANENNLTDRRNLDEIPIHRRHQEDDKCPEEGARTNLGSKNPKADERSETNYEDNKAPAPMIPSMPINLDGPNIPQGPPVGQPPVNGPAPPPGPNPAPAPPPIYPAAYPTELSHEDTD